MTILDVNIHSNRNLNYIVIIELIVCGGTVDDPTFSTSASPPPRGFKMWRWRHGDITEESTNRRFKKNQKDQKAIKANAGITKERNRTVSSQGGSLLFLCRDAFLPSSHSPLLLFLSLLTLPPLNSLQTLSQMRPAL